MFLFPVPNRSRWDWNVLDDRGYGAEQYMWEAVWDHSAIRPYSLGQGFQIGVRIRAKADPRNGSLRDVLQESVGMALLEPPRGLDVAYTLEREGALSADEHEGSVRVVLRRSPTFTRLVSSYPDSIRLEARLPLIGVTLKKTVLAEYRR